MHPELYTTKDVLRRQQKVSVLQLVLRFQRADLSISMILHMDAEKIIIKINEQKEVRYAV